MPNRELAPTDKVPTERLTRLRAFGFYLQKLLEERLELAALTVLGEVGDGIVYQLDPGRHRLALFQLITGEAEAVEHVVEGMPPLAGGEKAG